MSFLEGWLFFIFINCLFFIWSSVLNIVQHHFLFRNCRKNLYSNQTSRYPYPRIPTPQYGPLRRNHSPRLAKQIHIPTRIIPFLSQQSPKSLLPLRRPHFIPRNHNRSLLRHHPRRFDQLIGLHLPFERSKGLHWPLLHGLGYQPFILPRRLRRMCD